MWAHGPGLGSGVRWQAGQLHQGQPGSPCSRGHIDLYTLQNICLSASSVAQTHYCPQVSTEPLPVLRDMDPAQRQVLCGMILLKPSSVSWAFPRASQPHLLPCLCCSFPQTLHKSPQEDCPAVFAEHTVDRRDRTGWILRPPNPLLLAWD